MRGRPSSAMTFMLTRNVRSSDVVENRWDMSCSTSTPRFLLMTSLVGSSWSDSSLRSSTCGSFLLRICVAICSWILAPDIWYGSDVMMMSLPSVR